MPAAIVLLDSSYFSLKKKKSISLNLNNKGGKLFV